MRLKQDCKISINTFVKLQVDCCDDPMHHACRCRFLHLQSKGTHFNGDILIKQQIIKKENIQIEKLVQCRCPAEEEDDHILDSFLTLRNSAMLEKYFWFASAPFFSSGCWFTISSPYREY